MEIILDFAFDADLLEKIWNDVKKIMAKPSLLDPMTKELIYAAVSIAILLTDEQYAEFLSIVSLGEQIILPDFKII